MCLSQSDSTISHERIIYNTLRGQELKVLDVFIILPRLLQRSKKCRGHYSTIYHAT